MSAPTCGVEGASFAGGGNVSGQDDVLAPFLEVKRMHPLSVVAKRRVSARAPQECGVRGFHSSTAEKWDSTMSPQRRLGLCSTLGINLPR